MAQKSQRKITIVGIDIGKNLIHLIGLDKRGAVVLRVKQSRIQLETLFANMPACLIGIEACVGAHHLARRLAALGHDAKLMLANSKGRDFAAWLGLVPRQMSTGDGTVLGSISKRGNKYLRQLFFRAA